MLKSKSSTTDTGGEYRTITDEQTYGKSAEVVKTFHHLLLDSITSEEQTINRKRMRIEIPIDSIKINRRMRRTDEARIQDLAESIKNIGLLHSISVALKDDTYILLSGLHRIESFKLLGRTTIPATVRESNEHINQLIEVEENLVRSELNAIQTAEHIIKREQLLIDLGKKAIVGNNQYTEDKITNEDLARQMGYTKENLSIQKISCQSESRS